MSRLSILPILGLIATLGIACSDEGDDLPTETTEMAPSATLTPASATVSPTITDWKRYTDPDGRFVLSYPSNWYLVEGARPGGALNFTISSFEGRDTNETPAGHVRVSVLVYSQYGGSDCTLHPGETQVANLGGIVGWFTESPASEGYSRSKSIVVNHATYCFVVGGSFGSDARESIFNQMVSSFEFTDSATPGTLWRWMNVTLEIPADSHITVYEDDYWLDDHSPPHRGVNLVRYTNDKSDFLSFLVLDAMTGETITDKVRNEDRAEIDRIAKTMQVSELDRTTAGWPYSGDPGEDDVRVSTGQYSYIQPSPNTGLQIYTAIGDGPSPNISEFVGMTNGSSVVTAAWDRDTGALNANYDHVPPQDLDFMQRWVATIFRCPNLVCPPD